MKPRGAVHPSLARSLGIFFAGLALGLLAGWLLAGSGWRAGGHHRGAATQSDRDSAARAAAGEEGTGQDEILLGDIGRVPFQELYETLARRTPAQIAQLARQLAALPQTKEADAKISAFFKAWAHLDGVAAFKSAVEFRTLDGRTAAITATIAGADSNIAGVLARSLNELGDGVLADARRMSLFSMAVEKWSESDPSAAAELLNATSTRGLKFTPAFYTVALNWGAVDPHAALAWAQAHGAGSLGMSPVTGAVNGWWQRDHEAAEAYALAQINLPEGRQMISSLVSQMANEDRRRAQEWVSRLPNPEVRMQAENVLASQWAFGDAAAATAWAASLPDNERQGPLESTISMWARSDPVAAAQWLGTLSGTVRDQAVNAYSLNIAENEPAAAGAWAATIAEQNLREQTLQNIATQWLSRDPAAARAWIRSSALSDTLKTHLLALAPGK